MVKIIVSDALLNILKIAEEHPVNYTLLRNAGMHPTTIKRNLQKAEQHQLLEKVYSLDLFAKRKIYKATERGKQLWKLFEFDDTIYQNAKKIISFLRLIQDRSFQSNQNLDRKLNYLLKEVTSGRKVIELSSMKIEVEETTLEDLLNNVQNINSIQKHSRKFLFWISTQEPTTPGKKIYFLIFKKEDLIKVFKLKPRP
jgi:DNA-binding PadR family transcriptional regulator